MRREIYLYEDDQWDATLNGDLDSKNTLVICFGSSSNQSILLALNDVFTTFPNSIIMGCSTAGEIYDAAVYDDTLSIAVIKFEKTILKHQYIKLNNVDDSFQDGAALATQLNDDNLKAIFVLSDGLNINGSALTKGFNSVLNNTIITGGLAGDGSRFEKTWVLINNELKSNYITAIGFYGDFINVAHASQGGWQKFGIDRMVTEARNNILYKLDNKPALEVYKTYLGDSAKDLPSSGLLYPLMIKENGSNESKVRTILAINEEDQSITFAGDIPNGSEVMFMKATFSELIDGASGAANTLNLSSYNQSEAINIAISCIGRKLVLSQKVDDETEAVLNNLPENIKQIGYYSYGEISPLNNGKCDLHNQTMTLSVIWES